MRLRLFLTSILLAAHGAWAVDPSAHITQYAHTAWRLQDGFVSGEPTAIAQTSDGYLWIGTANGLFRFDGVHFAPWSDFAAQKEFATAEVSALLGGRDGSLWIGAGYRLYRWKDGSLSEYSNFESLVDAIIETADGTIWLTRQRISDGNGSICQVEELRFHCYGERDGVPLPYATSLTQDASGKFWIGSSTKLLRWKPGSSEIWTLKALERSEGLDGMMGMVVDRNHSLWVGISHPGPGLGLEQFRDGVWKAFSSPQLDGSKLAVSTLFQDKDDALWVGTDGQGIYRIVNGRVDHFDSADGLTSDKIDGFFEDHEGTLWVATSTGLDCFRDLPIVTLSKREGIHRDDARSILSATDGTIWIGNDHALDVLRNGVVRSVQPKDGLPGQQVTSLLEDPRGGLWVGVDTGLFHFQQGKFVPVIPPSGSHVVFDMTYGMDGSMWAITSGPTTIQLYQIHDDHLTVSRTFPPRDLTKTLATDPHGRLWLAGDKLRYLEGSRETTLSEFDARYGYIRNIAVDGDAFVWFGATKGLIGYRDGRLRAMTVLNGLPCERINTLILDNHRALWLYAQCGLIRIDHNELENWWQHPDAPVKSRLFDALDGFQGAPSSFRPAAAKSADGRLWFVNYSVVQTVDPDHLYENQLPPPTRIEQVVADTKSYSPEEWARFPKLTRSIEIKYAALSFVVSQRVRFRYQLEGYDPNWQEAGTRRSAFYTNLRPGTYRFLVTACNNSGVWNNQGAAFQFVILPAWYQTIWFRLLAVLSVAVLSYAFYLSRMRQYTAVVRARFNERLDERVRIARELHDTLLQSFHGLMFQFQAARNLLPRKPESVMQALDEAILATEQALAEGRDAIHDLRPESGVQHDLAELLTAAGQALSKVHSAKGDPPSFRVIVEGTPQKLSPTLQDEIYRIGAEVIRNAFHHAAASNIEVEVRYDGPELRLRIRDDGKGIDRQELEANRHPGHWGLSGMRERAQRIGSRLRFWSEAGAGTEVELRVPAAMAYEKKRGLHRFLWFYGRGSNGGKS